MTANVGTLIEELAVLLLHLSCCVLQSACGSPSGEVEGNEGDGRTPREELKEALARGGHRPAEAPLIGPGTS